MLRVAYNGSWFDNLADPLVWDSPLRLDDSRRAPGRGRMSLWPSNSAQTISFGGYTKLAHKTQVTGFFSYGLWSNDEPLQPFTINSALPPIALPRANADAEAHVFSTNLNLRRTPPTDWRFGARFRNYTYDNHMPATSITQYINYDSWPSTTPTGGPDLYAHDRTTFDARRDLEQDQPARADRRLHAQRQRLRRADRSSRAARMCSGCRPTRSEPRGSRSGRNTSSASAPVPAWTSSR